MAMDDMSFLLIHKKNNNMELDTKSQIDYINKMVEKVKRNIITINTSIGDHQGIIKDLEVEKRKWQEMCPHTEVRHEPRQCAEDDSSNGHCLLCGKEL